MTTETMAVYLQQQESGPRIPVTLRRVDLHGGWVLDAEVSLGAFGGPVITEVSIWDSPLGGECLGSAGFTQPLDINDNHVIRMLLWS